MTTLAVETATNRAEDRDVRARFAEAKNAYLASFTRIDKTVGGSERMWMDPIRQAAMSRFSEVGFPSTREEEWRFTNVAPIAKTTFAPGKPVDLSRSDIAAFSMSEEAACELVFVNGHYSPKLSRVTQLPRGVRVVSMAAAAGAESQRLQEHVGRYADIKKNPFVALNTGFLGDGAMVHLSRGAEMEPPVHLLFVSTADGAPTVSHPRVLIVADEGANASVVETHVGLGGGSYFTNAVTEVVQGQNSFIDHNKLQQESRAAYHVSTTQAQLGRGATFVSHAATIGAALARNDLGVVLGGEGAEATLNGLVLINGQQHCDNHTLLDHAKPHCPSYELYKHVLDGHSTGVFKGKILVRQEAQKTDSKQTSRTLLLSDDAYMNSQPALEIYADDVKCTHGSTTGPVDDDMLFYLRSRGVSAPAARHLLSYAFAADITRRIRVDGVRRRLEDYMAAQHGLPQDLRITDLGRYDEKHR